MGKFVDLTNNKYGRLKVLKINGKQKTKITWLCRCDCGKILVVTGESMKSGNTLSCGCMRSEMVSNKNRSHNMSKTPIYHVWQAMKNRCLSSNDKQFKDYGGRGICVCDKWKTFEGFYEDMGESYRSWLTIERIDRNGNYCLENCTWADRITQGNNTSRNRLEIVDGITDTVANHARRYGHTYSTVQHRLQRNWNVEEAFKTPRIR